MLNLATFASLCVRVVLGTNGVEKEERKEKLGVVMEEAGEDETGTTMRRETLEGPRRMKKARRIRQLPNANNSKQTQFEQ